MNMVKKCVVIFEFSKDNSTKFLTPMAWQPCDQPNKVVLPKNKGAKQKSCVIPLPHLFVNKGEKTNVKGVVDHIGNEILPQSLSSHHLQP